MDIDDLDMDQAMIELDKYMSRKLKQPFNISALTETLNATQNKMLIEHQNLEGLHNSVKHLAGLEALPTFQLSDMDPLGTVTHTKITMMVSMASYSNHHIDTNYHLLLRSMHWKLKIVLCSIKMLMLH